MAKKSSRNNKKAISSALSAMIFTDFSQGLYLLETPRNIGEQISSLAITGGRNVWSEKGALVPQYGYTLKDELPEGEQITGYTKITEGNNSFFITTASGKVYLYTAYQGLKEYKTTFENIVNPLIARRGLDMVITVDGNTFLFGAYYNDSDNVEIISNITIQDYSSYYEFTVPAEYARYFWNGKDLCFNTGNHMSVTSCGFVKGDETQFTVRVISSTGTHESFPEPVTINEKTKMPIILQYTPEKTGDKVPEPVTINPKLLAVCVNRLFVEDSTGRIYYSQVGNINSFDQALGAGYTERFYSDTTELLSMENYKDGVLICKQNGIYYMEISDSVIIQKISSAGQEYANDHVIVGNDVYCYDATSGSIVKAVSVNALGTLVSGKPIVSNEYLNTENSGINNSPRFLVYNAESEVLILYYGQTYRQGIVLTNVQTIWNRELDVDVLGFIGFNQGVAFITQQGKIMQDFKNGTVIPNLSCVANFEPIGVRDNRMICSSLLEITELNGIDYSVSTRNAGYSYQEIHPSFNNVDTDTYLPPFLYSTEEIKYDSFEKERRWTDKTSRVCRIYAPMSGREGISLTFNFPANMAFCLSALRLVDFSQGE